MPPERNAGARSDPSHITDHDRNIHGSENSIIVEIATDTDRQHVTRAQTEEQVADEIHRGALHIERGRNRAPLKKGSAATTGYSMREASRSPLRLDRVTPAARSSIQ